MSIDSKQWRVKLTYLRTDSDGDDFVEDYSDEKFEDGLIDSIASFGLPIIGYTFISEKENFIVKQVYFDVNEKVVDIFLYFD
ncbi:MAG: hypothetical protein ACK5B9_04530 [Flavobacteriia bacterium]|jgi:hypothetical protein